MPISVDWVDNDRAAIRAVFTGVVDFDELDRVIGRTVEMLNSVDHPVDVLLLVDQSDLPGSILARLPRIAGHPEYWDHRNFRRLFVVGANSFVRTMMKIYMQMYPAQSSKFVVVDTEAEAHQMIRDTPAG